MTSDRDRSDLYPLLEDFYRIIYTKYKDDDETLEQVRRELEDLLLAVENNLCEVRMSKIEE